MFRLVHGPVRHLYNAYQGSFYKIKPLGCKVNHTPPSSSTKVKNEWSYRFYSPICLHSVERENLKCNLSECDCICMCNMTECIHTSAMQWKYIYMSTSPVDRSVMVFHNCDKLGHQTATPLIFISGGTQNICWANMMLKHKVHCCYT